MPWWAIVGRATNPATLTTNKTPMSYTTIDRCKALLVHLFTASGLVVGFAALVALHHEQFKLASLLMLVTLVIDAVDGTLARRYRVKEVLPQFNGSTIDYVIDFFTYAILPTFFLYQAQLLPHSVAWVGMSVVLLVSAMYYGKEGMVSDSYHFVGFPVMWNVVVWYMYFILHLPAWLNFAAVLFFGVLHFVPILYPYPSRTVELRWLNVLVSAICVVASCMAIIMHPHNRYWGYLALLTVAYYTVISLYYTYRQGKINKTT